MKPCEICGYEQYHDPKTCKVHVAEKKKIHHFKTSRKNVVGPVVISRKNILALADYLNKKRQ